MQFAPPVLAARLAPAGHFYLGAKDMAKKRKKCSSPTCIPCRWWPKISKLLGQDLGCYWIDRTSGEVFIATGLRALPGGHFVEIKGETGPEFFIVECECGSKGPVRADLLHKGTVDRCPDCSAQAAQTLRN
jgi:hypothetical protein